MKIEERERVCLNLIRKFPSEYILVGGYAVSAYEFPRFSVNLDVLIRDKDLKEFSDMLNKEGFYLLKEAGEFARVYEGKFLRFEKRVNSLPVSVDLLVNMIQSRQTGAAYSFDYVWRNSEIRRITGFGTRDWVDARVADREMLMALKINSMRLADQRDIIALCSGDVNTAKITAHLKRAPKKKILSHIKKLKDFIQNPKNRDSLKGVFVLSDAVLDSLLKKTEYVLEEIHKGLAGD